VRYFEDFAAGDSFDLARRRITRDEIVDFARRYDPQPFHLDEAAAARTHFGGLVASGWHTLCVGMRLFVDGVLSSSSVVAAAGVEEVRWLTPVRPDDELRLRATVLHTRPSRRPGRGRVRWRWDMSNQDDRLVATVTADVVFATRG
jgi:acyl dehydratase